MGTISDKLMRVINTKEDIRKALISKGYDVPTSIPFKEYAKMISDLPCRVDSFPDIEGIVARYSALGLTNEQMEENPVWKDLTGDGHDLQMKNFAWSGMSGVGGYVQNFNNFGNNLAADKVRIDERNSNSIKITILITGIGNTISIKKSAYQFNKSYFIKISSEGYNEGDLSLLFYATLASTATTVKVPLNPNGITEIPAIKEDDFLAVFINVGGKVGSLTIEQLPLYPGFILGDVVDDFAVTEKELNFEDTYTVYTAFIPFQVDPVRAMEMCGKDFKKDFYLYYSNTHVVYYTSGLNNYIPVRINQFHIIVCKRNKTNAVIKNLITGESKTFSVSELIDNPGVYYLWRYQRSGTSTAKTAIAGQTICNGYFSTDEDDEKVLDWYKKQMPWLFPDQAWTVTGKTNEDEDRATIANITGNSNDLVLSNFGFVEGSGYNEEGEYAGYLVTDGVDDKVVSAESIAFTDTWTIITDTVFLGKVSVASGILASNIFTVYNYQGSGTIAVTMGEGGSSLRVITSSIKAFSSDGTIYDAEWNEYHVEIGTIRALERLLKIGTSSNETSYFCQLAFKFLGIYNNQILSKDDCIKAYNYLQTLKAK